MKVCCVVMNSICRDPRVSKQIKECLRRGIEVVGVGYKDNEYDENIAASLNCKIELAEIDDAYYFNGKRSLIKSARREREKAKKVARLIIENNPDIIHANDLTGLVPAVKAAAKLKCPIVYDSHEICTENINLMRKPLQKAHMKFQEKRCIKKAATVVSVSHSAGEILKQMYDLNEVMVVTNSSFLTDEEHMRAISKKPIKEVLIHGRFYAGRGYDTFVKAALLTKDRQDICWVIRGFGPMEEQLRNFCQENKLENVRFDPPVKVNELVEKAAQSHIGIAITEPICLNFVHSVSNKIFEYAAAGLPVIMSNIPEHQYLNNKYSFGIILEKDTPQAIAQAVSKLIDDQEFYNHCRENAFRMSHECNWETEYGKLIDRYFVLCKK